MNLFNVAMVRSPARLFGGIATACWLVLAQSVGATIPIGTYPAVDSAAITLTEADHQEVLGPVVWENGSFEVKVEPGETGIMGEDAIVSFPSPRPMHQPAEADVVSLDWYMAFDGDGGLLSAPVVVISPETDGRRVAARALGGALRGQGVHALVLHPPGYGRRNVGDIRRNPVQLLDRVRQTVADARRARDAAMVLPGITGHKVHLAGISLGGFSATLTAALDDGFDQTFVIVAGGGLYDIITHGKRDAEKFLQRFQEAGFSLEQIEQALNLIEPLRVADRIPPGRLWLLTARYDEVIPPKNSDQLAKKANLPADRRIIYPANHYTAAFVLPQAAERIADAVRETPSPPAE